MKSLAGMLPVAARDGSPIDYPGVASARGAAHIAVLDGWRGISILLVLATHLLPLGPKEWKLNHASGVMGMALFFVLSGFLITSFLLKRPAIGDFLTRRFFRIAPLAWAYIVIALFIAGASSEIWLSHMFFYANLPPQGLVPLTGHLWSVCLEVQFYIGIAVLVAILGTRGLMLIPVLCIIFTTIRVLNEVYVSSISYYRVDEILVGCLLALIYERRFGQKLLGCVSAAPLWLLIPLFMLSSLIQSEWLNYFRPYFAALVVGNTLFRAEGALTRFLGNSTLGYIAGVSYALYIIHPMLAASWLGSGSTLERYAKRPLLFAVLFATAHISTHFYERPFMALGRKLAVRFGYPALRHSLLPRNRS